MRIEQLKGAVRIIIADCSVWKDGLTRASNRALCRLLIRCFGFVDALFVGTKGLGAIY